MGACSRPSMLFVQTGGTVDKDYPRTAGYAFEIGEPACARVLHEAGVAFDYEVVTAARKDSNDLTASDRERVRTAISGSPHQAVIVTHGTDTLLETARVLEGSSGKTVILTGAYQPERFRSSDASFNVGVAVAAAQTLPAGVYIAIHGLVMPSHRCVRDEATGRYRRKAAA